MGGTIMEPINESVTDQLKALLTQTNPTVETGGKDRQALSADVLREIHNSLLQMRTELDMFERRMRNELERVQLIISSLTGS